MDKEKITQRIKELEDEKAKLQANWAALEGAIQDSKYWLSKLEEETNDKDSSD